MCHGCLIQLYSFRLAPQNDHHSLVKSIKTSINLFNFIFSASLEGETSTPFVMGVAEFTRLRVDRPGQELSLMFRTDPTHFEAATMARFQVVAPPADTLRRRLEFVLQGNLEALAGDSTTAAVQSAIRMGLGSELDVDVSRIEDVTYTVRMT